MYPRGAGPGAVAEYAAHAAAHPSIMSGEEIPTTAAEAMEYWARWGAEHARARASTNMSLHTKRRRNAPETSQGVDVLLRELPYGTSSSPAVNSE